MPDDRFWQAEEEHLVQTSPWCDDVLDEARSELFLAALHLHEAFIRTAAGPFRSNLYLFIDLLGGKIDNATAKRIAYPLWQTLFLVIPVVSTSFHSVASMFDPIGREAFGWLVIDEAGQAVPQAAVGALWRTRRAIVLGDPQQIEPVVGFPRSVGEHLAKPYGVGPDWNPHHASVQSLADRVSRYGTELDVAGAQWVGTPLRVHHRCAEPMFSLANQVAYGGLMVRARYDASTPTSVLGESRWIDVSSGQAREHWVPAQGDVALELVMCVANSTDEQLSDVFVISPFRDVVSGFCDFVRNHIPASATRKQFLDKGIGTVHTFQGKEADSVILLLGGSKQRLRAIEWAASGPNILNVALTRARKRIIVIGDRNIWGRMQYFDVVAERLPREDWDERATK